MRLLTKFDLKINFLISYFPAPVNSIVKQWQASKPRTIFYYQFQMIGTTRKTKLTIYGK